MAINKLLGRFRRRFVIGTIKVDGLLNAAVVPDNVGPVMGHGRSASQSFRRLQSRGTGPIIQVQRGVGLARATQQIVPVCTNRVGCLLAHIFGKRRKTILQCPRLFETSPILHGALLSERGRWERSRGVLITDGCHGPGGDLYTMH
jgi:hypothetical protein